MTIKSALFALMDDLPAGHYGLWDITDMLNLRTGRRTMPHTVRRYLADYCDIAGASFTCVVNANSIYEYVPGFKVSGSLEGKE